jgi:hypothetical protein
MIGKNMEKLVKEHSGVTVVVPGALVKIYYNGSDIARSYIGPSTCFDYHLEKLGAKFHIKSIAPFKEMIYVVIEPKA